MSFSFIFYSSISFFLDGLSWTSKLHTYFNSYLARPENVFEDRRSQLLTKCQLPSPYDKDPITVTAKRMESEELGYKFLAAHANLTNNFIVDDVHRTLYCYVPKVRSHWLPIHSSGEIQHITLHSYVPKLRSQWLSIHSTTDIQHIKVY